MTEPKTLLAAIITIPLLACAGLQHADEPADPPIDRFADEPADPAPDIVIDMPTVYHEIRRGEYLHKIALKHHVSWEQVLLANETMLKERHNEICDELAKRPGTGKKRTLLGCNPASRMPYAGNLKPGWTLTIPQAEPPRTVNDAVEGAGKRVALVIEDTGSGDLAKTIAQMYLSALREHGKRLVGVYLISGGNVRLYRRGDVIILSKQTAEDGIEALQMVAHVSPDAIILIASGSHAERPIETGGLPPIITHCIPNHLAGECRNGLADLANATGGSFVPSLQ
jgi:hypothetical protein